MAHGGNFHLNFLITWIFFHKPHPIGAELQGATPHPVLGPSVSFLWTCVYVYLCVSL